MPDVSTPSPTPANTKLAATGRFCSGAVAVISASASTMMVPVATPTSPRQKPSQANPPGTADAASASVATPIAMPSTPRAEATASNRADNAAPAMNPNRFSMPTWPASTAVSAPNSTSAGTIAV